MVNAIIVAKGPTAKYLMKNDYPDTIIIGINQACIFIDKPDFVFMNDIDSLDGLTSIDVQNIECFVIPEYPHIHEGMNINITKDDFIERLNNLNYMGRIETFNLHTSPSMKSGLVTTENTCVTTVHTAIYYMNKRYNLDVFETYGFLINIFLC